MKHERLLDPLQSQPILAGRETWLPIGLKREQAAYFVGVSSSKFDDWIKKGLMPKPKREGGCVRWDTDELRLAFKNLPSDGDVDNNPWDD